MLEGAAAHVTGRGDGDRYGTERHGGGVGDEHDGRGLQRRDAERENHGGGYGHRCAEARERLEQAAEAEGDEHGLDAHVAVAHFVEDEAQILEAAGGDRDLVEPDRCQDDEDNGEEAKEPTAQRCGKCHSGGHVEAQDGHQQCDDKSYSTRCVRAGFQPQQHDEEGQKRQGRHQCRKTHAATDGIGDHLKLVHGKRSFESEKCND